MNQQGGRAAMNLNREEEERAAREAARAKEEAEARERAAALAADEKHQVPHATSVCGDCWDGLRAEPSDRRLVMSGRVRAIPLRARNVGGSVHKAI